MPHRPRTRRVRRWHPSRGSRRPGVRPAPSPTAVLASATLLVAAGAALALVPAVPAQEAPRGAPGPAPLEPLVFEASTVEAADGKEHPAERATLVVRERHGDPESGRVELPVVRLARREGVPEAPPVLYLAGGPGGSAVASVRIPQMWEIYERLREHADVVLVDQRGTGGSSPGLLCRYRRPLPEDGFVRREGVVAFIREEMRACAARFREQGVDPAAYTSVASADDLRALRRGLGAERIRLLGFSYGTHLALATIRRLGDRVDRAVLVGTEGPDHTYKLPSSLDTQIYRLSRLAAADPDVGGAVPDMEALLGRVLEDLEAEPVTVTVPDGEGRAWSTATWARRSGRRSGARSPCST